MIPAPQDDRGIIDYWVDDIKSNSDFLFVINSKPFIRLSNISFLGAQDYLVPNGSNNIKKRDRSRAHHSLHVAALANYVATEREYSNDLKAHLIIAGLLHDIGHPPLSHSAEPYFKERFGYGHHEMGAMLLTGEISSGKELYKYLSNNFDLGFILKLLDKEVDNAQGGDLFSSLINIDTIEGITRSYKYVFGAKTSHEPLKYARASFLLEGRGQTTALDQFWKLKHFVYNKIINSESGVSADKYSQVYFSDNYARLCEKDLFTSERSWKQKYSSLFTKLNDISRQNKTPDEICGVPVMYYKRDYVINDSRRDAYRYQFSKQKCYYEFSRSSCKKEFFLQKELDDGNLLI